MEQRSNVGSSTLGISTWLHVFDLGCAERVIMKLKFNSELECTPHGVGLSPIYCSVRWEH